MVATSIRLVDTILGVRPGNLTMGLPDAYLSRSLYEEHRLAIMSDRMLCL